MWNKNDSANKRYSNQLINDHFSIRYKFLDHHSRVLRLNPSSLCQTCLCSLNIFSGLKSAAIIKWLVDFSKKSIFGRNDLWSYDPTTRLKYFFNSFPRLSWISRSQPLWRILLSYPKVKRTGISSEAMAITHKFDSNVGVPGFYNFSNELCNSMFLGLIEVKANICSSS